MKKFDKFILWLFSLIILLIVVFFVLLAFNLFSAREILETIPKKYYNLLSTDKDIVIVSTVVLLIFFMLSLKGFLFQSKTKKDKIDGILLENNNGKLLISRETLENLVRDISKKIQGTESIYSKIHLDDNNEIVVNINAVVYQDAVIKEVTKKMQEDIKSAIKQASDLEVSEVNVNIDKISNKVNPDKKQREEKFEEKVEIKGIEKEKEIEEKAEEDKITKKEELTEKTEEIVEIKETKKEEVKDTKETKDKKEKKVEQKSKQKEEKTKKEK